MQHRIVATRKNADLEIVKMTLEKPRKVICPNCENEFDREFGFCPHCGQQNKTINLHLKHFLHDFLLSAFNLDKEFLYGKLVALDLEINRFFVFLRTYVFHVSGSSGDN